jgi:hypothetical protein
MSIATSIFLKGLAPWERNILPAGANRLELIERNLPVIGVSLIFPNGSQSEFP